MGNNLKGKAVLVVDIGSYSLKLLVGKVSGNTISIKKAHSLPISANIYVNGDIQNIMELSSVLKDFVKENGLRNAPVIFTFGSTSTITRVLEIPAVKESELKEVVEFEMQQFLPADVSLYLVQYKRLETAVQKDGIMKLMVGTIPKSVAENFWALAIQCELVPIALDINTNALTKLFETVSGINKYDRLKNEAVALIEIGHTLMDVCVFERGEFLFSRRILIGGQNIDQRIERLLEISTDQARMEKHIPIDINEDVFDYTDENRVFNSLKSGVDEWIGEIEKVVKFYTSRKVGNKLDRCFIYGGGASIKGIDTYISKTLDIKTEGITSLGGLVGINELEAGKLGIFINTVGAMIRKEEHK